jgi:hypothetical protein
VSLKKWALNQILVDTGLPVMMKKAQQETVRNNIPSFVPENYGDNIYSG